MKKPVEEMDEKEMLALLVKIEKRNTLGRFLALLANLALLVVLLAVIVLVLPRYDRLLQMARQIESLSLQAEEAMENIDVMVKNINSMVEESAGGLKEGIDNVNSLDFDSLNEAITDLHGIAGKLNGTLAFFGGDGG